MNKIYEHVYEPEEDSKLLLKWAIKEMEELETNGKRLKVCEVGVGSGFVVSNVSRKFSENQFFGSDINHYAIDITGKIFDKNNINIKLYEGNLLEGFEDKFDIILFNAPYFPFEAKDDSFEKLSLKDRAIYGGKKGYEIVEEFILQAKNKLVEEGLALVIFSSFTNKKYIEKLLKLNLLDFEILETEGYFFEKLYCLKFYKSEILKSLGRKGIEDLKYFSSGKHSEVFEGRYNGCDVIVKIGKAQHLEKEAFFERKLRDESFVPKMFFNEENFVVREKVGGRLIVDFFQNVKTRGDLIEVLDNILKVTKRLDDIGINKFEMTNPYKHIFVQEDLSVKFIDFERCIFSEHPKNTTQVLEFFRRYINVFRDKGLELSEEKILEVSRNYKKRHFDFNVRDLID